MWSAGRSSLQGTTQSEYMKITHACCAVFVPSLGRTFICLLRTLLRIPRYVAARMRHARSQGQIDPSVPGVCARARPRISTSRTSRTNGGLPPACAGREIGLSCAGRDRKPRCCLFSPPLFLERPPSPRPPPPPRPPPRASPVRPAAAYRAPSSAAAAAPLRVLLRRSRRGRRWQ